MTLLLALSNESYSLVLGDRRLVCNGGACEDESNKVCVLFCDDARVAIAYTGVAVHGQFRTQDWLRDTLAAVGQHKHTLDEILAELQTRGSIAYARLPAKTRPIGFLISGYRYTTAGPQHTCRLLSNFDPAATSWVAGKSLEIHQLGAPGKVVVEAAGFTSVITDDDRSDLRKMLEAGIVAPAVLHKAVEVVRRAAKQKAAQGTIGLQTNSAIVPRDVDSKIISTYHSARPVTRVPGPAVVIAVTGCCGVCHGMFMAASGAILAGPDIRKNENCWCGSGKKFRACHLKKYGSVYARLPGFRRPLAMTFAMWRKEPVLSGRVYCAFSSFD
jgi:hypothetical protein